MSELVDPKDIERIVGVKRFRHAHWARAVSAEQRVYILHSQDCLNSGIDLRECDYSLALDRGIDPSTWVEDSPVEVMIFDGILCMAGSDSAASAQETPDA